MKKSPTPPPPPPPAPTLLPASPLHPPPTTPAHRQALLCAAFLPNLALGRTTCPPAVLADIARHRLDPSRTVAFIVGSGSQGGAHLTQANLAAALKPCGKLEQSIISKSRVHVNGALSLQTSAVLSFASQEGALLALRMAGMRGSLPVPLTGADGTTRQPVGTAWLQAPQYACRLRFQRLTCLEDAAAVAPPEPAAGGVEGAAPAGLAAAHDDAGESAEVLPVDQARDVAEGWPRGSRGVAEGKPSCSRVVAELSRGLAEG